MFLRLTDHQDNLVLINFDFVKRATVHATEGTSLVVNTENSSEKILNVREAFEAIAQRLGIDAPGELRQLRAV